MSEETGEWLERHYHPLLNNVILNIVFKHLRGKDLKTCRLICKVWNPLTIPLTRKFLEVAIIPAKPMVDFMEVFRSRNLEIPYARFRFGSFCTTEGIGHEFLQLCGATIKSIRFISGVEFTVENVAELLKSTPKLQEFENPNIVRCPNQSVIKLFPEGTKPKLLSLKKLTVCEDSSSCVERNEFCPTYLEELIVAAPNISCLHLKDSNQAQREKPISFTWDVLKLIEKLGRESSIQELILSSIHRAYSEYFELLRKMTQKPNGLKLKRFEFERCDSEEYKGLLKIVSLFKDTLQYLKTVKINERDYMTFDQFEKMSELTKLCVWYTDDLNSRSVNLKEILPVLEELELLQYHAQELDEFFPDSEPCPLVHSLQLNNVYMRLNAFNQVLAVFPNLTSLTMSTSDDGALILPQICTKMTGLKSLDISGRVMLNKSMNGVEVDSLLTGSPANAFQRIKDALNHMEGRSELERQDTILKLRNEHCQLPSIPNLTDLRSLTLNLITGTNWFEQQRVTDLTGYLGLYSLKRLKHLKVSKCEFSKTCCEILIKDLGLESWSFNTPQNTGIIPSG